MKSFTDNAGRTWTISINVGTIKTIRALCDINILDVIKTNEDDGNPNVELLDRLSTDPVLLVDVLYAACKDEADKNKISDVEFGRAMTGDTIETATKALLQEIVDFFPQAKRQILQKVLAATWRFEAMANQKLEQLVNSGELDKMIDLRLNELNALSGSVPESAE